MGFVLLNRTSGAIALRMLRRSGSCRRVRADEFVRSLRSSVTGKPIAVEHRSAGGSLVEKLGKKGVGDDSHGAILLAQRFGAPA